MIELKAVSKRFGGVRALDSISLRVGAGETTAIRGPSGSGKTTLLRLIAGLEEPDEGEVWIDGEAVSRPGLLVAPHRRGIGFVFQQPALWPHMTVLENVAFGIRAGRSEKRRRAMEALEQIGLEALASRLPDGISGGEARRVSVARALAPRPSCVLMDEPLTNLDAERKWSHLEWILGVVHEAGATLIYVTHDEEEITRLGGQVFRLDHGRLLCTDTESQESRRF